MYVTRLTALGALASFVVVLLAPSATQATVKYWQPADGIGNWNYGPYWSPAGVPVAGDTARIEAGGSGWTLYCHYVNGTNPLLNAVFIGNLSTGTADARLIQDQDALHAGYEYVGYQGTGKHFQSGGSVTIDSALYLGYNDGSYGYYELNDGSLSAVYPYIGFGGSGDFVQTGGTFTCTQMNIANANYGGPYGVGSYAMQNGTLNAGLIYLGGKEEGTFTQSGGTVNALSSGITLGPDQYGGGHYALTSGDLNTYRTRLSQAGSTFSQSGGTHDITGDLEVGFGAVTTHEVLYTMSGTGTLTISGNVLVGNGGRGRYRQTAGIASVAGSISLFPTSGAPVGKLQLEGGSLSSTSVSNNGDYLQTGGTLTTTTWTNELYFEQTGGVLNATQLDNDSMDTLHIGGTANCRVNALNGHVHRIWQNGGTLRGRHMGGGVYYMCAFNNADGALYEMDAGEFVGHLTNDGTFTYNGGTFASSTLTNNGTVNLNAHFTCSRFVNNANFTLPSNRWITAGGVGYPNAVENNASLSMSPSSHIDVGADSPLVNNGSMYAGGPGSQYAHIDGDMQNNDYLLPSHSSLPSGFLYIDGDFTASSGATLRIRIHGTGLDDYDRLAVQGAAQLGGLLDVRLTSGFVPSLGNSFTVVGYTSHTGVFNPVSLPALPAGLEWELTYGATGVVLTVVEEPSVYYGDMNCDNVVDMDDVPLFVEALVDPANFSGCDIDRADANEDALIDGADVQDFLALLLD